MTPVALSVVLKWLNYSSFALNADSAGVGRADFLLTGFAAIDKACETDVTFWLGKNSKNETNANGVSVASLANVKAGLLFVPADAVAQFAGDSVDDFAKLLPGVQCVVPVNNPYHVMVQFLNNFLIQVFILFTFVFIFHGSFNLVIHFFEVFFKLAFNI